MELTIVFIGLLIGVGIPLRNKRIKKYRENQKNNSTNNEANKEN
ncbi:Uncharacterised protein [Clostridioides difficile]|nr:Uncharacterised protein [Clostridioides difficile]